MSPPVGGDGVLLSELVIRLVSGQARGNRPADPLREFFDIASSRLEAGFQEQPVLRDRLLAIMAESIATLGEESKAEALRRLADDLLTPMIRVSGGTLRVGEMVRRHLHAGSGGDRPCRSVGDAAAGSR